MTKEPLTPIAGDSAMTNLNPQRKYSIAELTELLYEADRVGNSELVLECCDIIDSRPEDNSYDHIEYKPEGWVWRRCVGDNQENQMTEAPQTIRFTDGDEQDCVLDLETGEVEPVFPEDPRYQDEPELVTSQISFTVHSDPLEVRMSLADRHYLEGFGDDLLILAIGFLLEASNLPDPQEPDAEWPSWVPNSRLYDEPEPAEWQALRKNLKAGVRGRTKQFTGPMAPLKEHGVLGSNKQLEGPSAPPRERRFADSQYLDGPPGSGSERRFGDV